MISPQVLTRLLMTTKLCLPTSDNNKEKFMKNMTQIRTLTGTVLAMVILAVPAFAAPISPALQARIEALAVELENKRVALHIPGMAIAVVHNDKVIMARGFGVTDITKKTPVTPQTLFAIGSTTKAFTATLIGMGMDRGEMQWDDPVTDYLPYLRFPLGNKDDQVTIRDMLSHRSGYSRNDILWASGTASRQEILRRAMTAKAWSEFRKKFNYNNVMYLGAGLASAKAANTNWDTLLEQRLLKPLGMNSTTTDYHKAQQNPDLSLGYVWDEEDSDYQHLPMQNLANIAPAGGINSNVLDMAQWVRFNLADGRFKGRQLVSASRLQDMRQAQINVTGNVDYGLGWFLRSWQGQPVIEHGGSIAGFAAQVAFLPQSDLGFVLLTNVTTTPLQQLSMAMVWEHILGTPKTSDQSQNDQDPDFYAPFIGDYTANFGAFNDAIIRFLIKDGRPAIDVPGQRIYALHDPDEDGKWVFTLTDTIAISFDRDAQRRITAMRMHQSGMAFDLPRKGVPILAKIDPALLYPLLGQYQSSRFGGRIKVSIQNTRLALDIPGEMVFELDPPDRDGHRAFRVKSEMSAVFETDQNGKGYVLSVYRKGAKIDTAPRAITDTAQSLPSVDQILALRQTEKRKAAFLRVGGVQLRGTMTMAQAGIVGTIISSFDGPDRFRTDVDFGKMGQQRVIANSNGAVTYGITPYRKLKGNFLKQVRLDHPAADIDWRHYYDHIEVVRSGVQDGKNVYLVKLKSGKIPVVQMLIDAETGDTLRKQTRLFSPVGGTFKVQVEYSDYRDLNGLRMPFHVVSKNKMSGKTEFVFDKAQTNIAFKATDFSLAIPQ